MEVLNQLRSSFRSRTTTAATRSSNSSIDTVGSSSTDGNNNSSAVHKKRGRQVCDLCGKRLMKLAGWRNYFTMPCKCHHMFCKQCITERLKCRQKVMRAVSFDLMWTFPCPGNAQCGQQLTVDFARGSSFSKNLVARDLESGDDSWDQDEYDEEVDDGVDDIQGDSSVGVNGPEESRLCETG